MNEFFVTMAAVRVAFVRRANEYSAQDGEFQDIEKMAFRVSP